MSSKKLMVMAGGTGGHVFPGLAVAHQLMEEGWEVRWLGTADRMEADLVPKHGIEIEFIKINGLRGKGAKALLQAPWRIFSAWRQARKIIKQWQPDIVLGMGGYVSGPGGLAAWSCGVPVVLHEQNGIAGLTNQWLSKIARKVLQAFPGAFAHADVVGNPVRKDVLALPSPTERFQEREGPLRVLIMGGSQGARILNQQLPEVAQALGNSVIFWHQTGKGNQAAVEQDYQQRGVGQHKITEFIDDVAAAYAWADVVVCRSGALTVSEIAAAGVSAIFVPFPHKDRQQYWNALSLEKAGAAVILEQPHFTAQAVIECLQNWDRKALLVKAEDAQKTAVRDSTQRVAQEIKRIVAH
ncbi:undecaprenyldiphospho-muramoylpentapeptide beta-N-acetylglucosaminyltransferase [Rosenbergiella collisarenosi]|uniref:undecaprenyldiphospho-muramoylpentapeptide beta-N-acetylglucosaminyltransferase n=1 Tax=Rosenbergiella collisarenosi TaxID=1544695 RepID=UPI001BD995E7|nr:undecaprenyldiphospho-muramoylpentapeptide beta-N-acetylglucosaminyltransferase [Rosenbergiella collisarenosi]MBT0720100.1 undecaprenyldiphospho-muramoylpentapeptide beta-N-acetylglucosaminyltransferase [Rosenbergiella collisarenosi]